MIWGIGAPAHGKGSSDEAGGGSKAAVLTENMLHTPERPTRIENIAQVRPLLQRVYQWPSKDILKKKGQGTMRRFIFDVPTSGPGHVKRPVTDIHSVVGSKPFKQFMSPSSVEDSANGIVWMRRRTCMQCEGCRNALRLSDFEACKYMEECGPVQQIQLVKKNCAPPTRITRSFLRDAGVKLGKGLRIGDLVVIELLNECETFMIGVVTKAWHKHEGPDVEVPCMGTVKQGDELVAVRKFERCSGGRGENIRVYELCAGDAKEFPVFTDDCRLVLEKSDFPAYEEIRSSARLNANASADNDVHGFRYKMKYKLGKEALNKSLALTCDDEDE